MRRNNTRSHGRLPCAFAAARRGTSSSPDSFYLLACEIPKSRNPLRYFRLDHCLRALHPAPVTFPLPAATTIELSLRPFAPSDPPITVNLPKLLYDFLRQRNP